MSLLGDFLLASAASIAAFWLFGFIYRQVIQHVQIADSIPLQLQYYRHAAKGEPPLEAGLPFLGCMVPYSLDPTNFLRTLQRKVRLTFFHLRPH